MWLEAHFRRFIVSYSVNMHINETGSVPVKLSISSIICTSFTPIKNSSVDRFSNDNSLQSKDFEQTSGEKMALECIRLCLCFLRSFCLPHVAFALAKSTAKMIFPAAEILHYAHFFRCLKIQAKHIKTFFFH